jgi:recombination protein RecA
MSQALRKLTATISKSGCCLVFINQIRMKIGVMFGNPETTTGGKALKFYSSIRLEVRKVETISKGSEDATGNLVRVKVVKNKVAPPFRKAEMEIIFGKGISASGSLLDAALRFEVIQKSGSWYSYGEERIGQGRDNAKQFLEGNPDIAAAIEKRVRELLFTPKVPINPTDDAAAHSDSDAVGGESTDGGRPSTSTENTTKEGDELF